MSITEKERVSVWHCGRWYGKEKIKHFMLEFLDGKWRYQYADRDNQRMESYFYILRGREGEDSGEDG